MKTVILAGGFGTRISEESHLKPKPMIEVGEKPILWHIMKLYSHYGFNEFIVCCGYKQHVIKEWFADYYLHNSDITFDFTRGENNMIVHNHELEPWKVTLIDTGLKTMTGGRVKRVQKYIGNETFFLNCCAKFEKNVGGRLSASHKVSVVFYSFDPLMAMLSTNVRWVKM